MGRLDAYTVSAADGTERNINVRNEWGGFSRRLKMPVFTGWQDHVRMVGGQMRVLVLDRNWNNTAGVNNQERLGRLRARARQRSGLLRHQGRRPAEEPAIRRVAG